MRTCPTMLTMVLLLVTGTRAWAQARDESLSGQQNPNAVREAFPDWVPISPATQTQPPTPRSLAVAGAFQEGVNFHTLAEVTAEEIAAADAKFEESPCNQWPGPARVGLVRAIEPAPLSANDDFVEFVHLPDGRTVWTSAIQSPEAYGVRVHFANFDVGPGSLIVYADDGRGLIVRGPYRGLGPNGKSDFWTPSLPGDTVFIEVAGTEFPRLEVAEICHFDKDLAGPGHEDDDGPPSGRELPCHLDVMCYDDPPVSVAARDATGKMNVMCSGYATGCTGTLLNDLDDETFQPYFLTAYHCLNTQAAVDTMEVVWFWQKDVCDGTLPNYFALPRNCGGTLLATNPTDGGNDMTFIRLDGGLPGGISLAGWTTGHPDPAVGIHHPSVGAGSWKRVVFLTDVGVCPGCEFCGDGTDYDYYDMAQGEGLTEPGSSGSGVFNSAGQLAGQLWGVCCVVPACADEVYDCNEHDEWVTQYGEFETTYPIIDY